MNATTGPLFQISESGAPGEISLTMCLNARGKQPLSCQNYLSHSSTLSITPTIPNHLYPYAGIKVNTPEFTLENLGLSTQTTNNGYGLFSFSSLTPKVTTTLNELNFLSVSTTNPVIAISISPTNMIDTLPPLIPDPLNITVGMLEEIFDSQFCQFNTQHNVTLNSPECQTLIQYVRQQPETGHFNLNDAPIINNPLGIQAVEFQKISYQTTVPLPEGDTSFNVSGGLIMPNGITKDQVKGVVVYFEGTQFDKASVGSNINFSGTQLVAATFASQGYIVAMPDYVGMGDDYQNVHPYVLYPKVSAKTAIDMLNSPSFLSKLETKYAYNLNADHLNVFSLGYSEGGAYSLWFNTYIMENSGVLNSFYQLTHSVGLSGAYSTSQVTADFLFDDVVKDATNRFNIQSQSLTNLSKPLLTADAFLSYATYSQGGNYDSVFNKNFYNMKCDANQSQSQCNINGQNLNLLEAFNQANNSPASQVLNSSLGKRAGEYVSSRNLALLAVSLHNTGIPLTSYVDFRNSPALRQVLEAADVNLTANGASSVSIIALSHDSIVSPNNFDLLNQTYPSKILNAIKLDENNFQVVSPFSYQRLACLINPACPPVYVPADHSQAQIYTYLYALHIFNGFTPALH